MAKKVIPASHFLAKAKELKIDNDKFFKDALHRYKEQISILKELEKAIKNDGTLVEKEYVKGRKNIYTNPAIAEYNKTVNSVNQTTTTIIKLIVAAADIKPSDTEKKKDELLEALCAD